MDLARFDTREKASEGVDFPLVIDDETVYGDDGEPVTFGTKGVADQAVHAEFLRQHRNQPKTPKEVYEADMKLARLAVTRWSDNFEVEGEKFSFSVENIPKVLSNPVVRAAVLKGIWEQKAFMKGS